MLKVTIFGAGYVGLVTGACLAEVGHDVVCVDTDEKKVDDLNRGIIPIYEPGLEDLIASNFVEKRLRFTTDAAQAIRHGDIQFIAVGTPPDEDGSADLRHVLAVARSIGDHLVRNTIIVNKSTVPVGTAPRVKAEVEARLRQRNAAISFEVVSNPEFLKEGDAIRDCMRPDRIIIGSESASAIDSMKSLYAPFNRSHERLLVMDVASAELTKYAANAMLATKISFMNEMSNIAERVGADIERVRQGIGSDSRIGYSFIYPGAGYGGSCFPKDVQALERTARQHGYEARILGAVEAVNGDQKAKLAELIDRHYGGTLSGKRFAIWGLAFKPNTDDIREAPSRILIDHLLASGATVRCYDPQASHEIHKAYGDVDGLHLCETTADSLRQADALVVVTEWKAFRTPDFESLAVQLADRVIFDGRNIYDPPTVEASGIAYYGIGRGRSIQVKQG